MYMMSHDDDTARADSQLAVERQYCRSFLCMLVSHELIVGFASVLILPTGLYFSIYTPSLVIIHIVLSRPL